MLPDLIEIPLARRKKKSLAACEAVTSSLTFPR